MELDEFETGRNKISSQLGEIENSGVSCSVNVDFEITMFLSISV